MNMYEQAIRRALERIQTQKNEKNKRLTVAYRMIVVFVLNILLDSPFVIKVFVNVWEGHENEWASMSMHEEAIRRAM